MEKFTPAETFDLLIFGGTGDLAVRKLLPALYHLDRKGQINRESRIIALSRRDFSQVEYLRFVLDGLKRHMFRRAGLTRGNGRVFPRNCIFSVWMPPQGPNGHA